MSSALDSVTDAAHLATITTDTGAFAPGRRDFTNYTEPGLCRAAALWTRRILQRHLDTQDLEDPLTFGNLRDTLGASQTAQVARACGTRFTVASTAEVDLYDLQDLAELEQNDTLMLAILARQNTIVPPATDLTARIDSTLWQIGVVRADLNAEPARWASVRAFLAQADARDTPEARIRLHGNVMEYLTEQQDTVGLRHEAEQLITLGHVIHPVTDRPATDEDRYVFSFLLHAYKTLCLLAVSTHPDSQSYARAITGIRQEARQALTRLMTSALHISFERFSGHTTDDKTVSQVLEGQLDEIRPPEWATVLVDSGQGERAPTLHSDFWFPAPGQPASVPERLVAGKVNLLCYGGDPEGNLSRQGLETGAGLAHEIRRVLQRYGSTGLVVTYVVLADGFRADALNTKNVVFPSAAEEAHFWDWYYHTYEHLPVAVAIQVKPSTFFPAPDGRRLSEAPTPIETYLGTSEQNIGPGTCAVISPLGHTLVIQNADRYFPDVLLRRLLVPVVSSTPLSPPVGSTPVPAEEK